MTTREDFEKWFADSYGIDISIDRAGEGYIYDQINDKWIGYQACAAHYEAELLKRDALIAEKDKALSACALNDIARKALSLPHDSVRLVEVYQVGVGYIPADRKTPPDGTKLYTIVKGE